MAEELEGREGQGRVKTIQRRLGTGKQWLLDSELGFPPKNRCRWPHIWEPETLSFSAVSQGHGWADGCLEPAEWDQSQQSLEV